MLDLLLASLSLFCSGLSLGSTAGGPLSLVLILRGAGSSSRSRFAFLDEGCIGFAFDFTGAGLGMFKFDTASFSSSCARRARLRAIFASRSISLYNQSLTSSLILKIRRTILIISAWWFRKLFCGELQMQAESVTLVTSTARQVTHSISKIINNFRSSHAFPSFCTSPYYNFETSITRESRGPASHRSRSKTQSDTTKHIILYITEGSITDFLETLRKISCDIEIMSACGSNLKNPAGLLQCFA